MTDDDWQSYDPRAWIDYDLVLNDMQEDTIRVIEWQDEAEQFEGVPEDFHLHIIEICLICGNPMESCVCEMPKTPEIIQWLRSNGNRRRKDGLPSGHSRKPLSGFYEHTFFPKTGTTVSALLSPGKSETLGISFGFRNF